MFIQNRSKIDVFGKWSIATICSIWAPYLAPVEAPWDHLEGMLGHLGSFSSHVGVAWVHLGGSLGHLGASWGQLGTSLGAKMVPMIEIVHCTNKHCFSWFFKNTTCRRGLKSVHFGAL